MKAATEETVKKGQITVEGSWYNGSLVGLVTALRNLVNTKLAGSAEEDRMDWSNTQARSRR